MIERIVQAPAINKSVPASARGRSDARVNIDGSRKPHDKAVVGWPKVEMEQYGLKLLLTELRDT